MDISGATVPTPVIYEHFSVLAILGNFSVHVIALFHAFAVHSDNH